MSVQTPDRTQLQPTTIPVSINAVNKITSESANDGQPETVIERLRPAEPSEKTPYESSGLLSEDSHNLTNRCTDKPRELHKRFEDIKKAWRSMKEAIKVAGKRVCKRRRSSNLDSPKVYCDPASTTTPPDYHGPNDPSEHRSSSRGYEDFTHSLQIVVGGEVKLFKGSFDTQSRYNYIDPDSAEAHFKSLIKTFAPHEVVLVSAVGGSRFTAYRYFDVRWSVEDSVKLQRLEISSKKYYTSRFLIPEKMPEYDVIIGVDTINHYGSEYVPVGAMAYQKPKTLQGAAKKEALLAKQKKEQALAEKFKAWRNSQGDQQLASPPAPTPGNSQEA